MGCFVRFDYFGIIHHVDVQEDLIIRIYTDHLEFSRLNIFEALPPIPAVPYFPDILSVFKSDQDFLREYKSPVAADTTLFW